MEPVDGLSVAHPRSHKFCKVLSSCWRRSWKKARSCIFSGLRSETNCDSAPGKGQECDSSSVLTPKHTGDKQDSRIRKDEDEYPHCEVGYCHRRHLPDSTYCKCHNCRTNKCNNIRARGSLHCFTHKCRSCNFKAKTRHNYCEEHQCRTPTCLRERRSGQDWCRRHVCQWGDCNKPPVKGGRYCGFHTCAAEGCVSKVLRRGRWVGDYCCCHTCCEDGCRIGVVSTAAFCAKHECPVHDCPNPRLWDGDGCGGPGCCKFHTCVERGCFCMAEKIGSFCELHAPPSSESQKPKIYCIAGRAMRTYTKNRRRRKARPSGLADIAEEDIEKPNSQDIQGLPYGLLCSAM